MKKLILNNWAVKIGALILAFTLWFLIKKKVESATPSPSSIIQFQPTPAPTPPRRPMPYIDFPTPVPTPEKTAKPSPTKSPHAKSNN